MLQKPNQHWEMHHANRENLCCVSCLIGDSCNVYNLEQERQLKIAGYLCSFSSFGEYIPTHILNTVVCSHQHTMYPIFTQKWFALFNGTRGRFWPLLGYPAYWSPCWMTYNKRKIVFLGTHIRKRSTETGPTAIVVSGVAANEWGEQTVE